MSWYNSQKKKFCKSCGKKTEHDQSLLKQDYQPREKLGFVGWLFVMFTAGGYLMYHFLMPRDEIYTYLERCEECGSEEETVSTQERVAVE
jgi:uncharacterized Zn finger protein